jgi:hypothetical protein
VRSGVWPAVNRHVAAECGRTLAHAEEAEACPEPGRRACAARGRVAHAAPVVAHIERDRRASDGEPDLRLRGLCVPRDVGERLLKHAEESRRSLGVEAGRRAGASEPALDAGACGEVLDLPLEGRQESEIVQDLRAEIGGDSSDARDHVIDHRDGPEHRFRPELAPILRDVCHQVHLQRRQRLPELVVDLA